MTKCDLCGYEYDKSDLVCHAGCPLAEGCAVICCPNCGYQVVDESKSKLVRVMRKMQETWVQWMVSSEKK